MRPITLEWVSKAEGDWHDTLTLYRARKHPNYDSACYHAHQCVEKYLKARLKEARIRFPKTHDLVYLLSLAMHVQPNWDLLLPQADALKFYAIEFRYPGKSATKTEAKQALKDCDAIRLAVRSALSLPV